MRLNEARPYAFIKPATPIHESLRQENKDDASRLTWPPPSASERRSTDGRALLSGFLESVLPFIGLPIHCLTDVAAHGPSRNRVMAFVVRIHILYLDYTMRAAQLRLP